MKRLVLSFLFSTLAIPLAFVSAQDKPKPEDTEKKSESTKGITPVRVQVVFTEYDGEKKISSLPYTLLVNADERDGTRLVVSILRMGLRVPIGTVTPTGAAGQFTYQDVGTNIDGRAERAEDGRFRLQLGVEKSSVYSSASSQKPASPVGNETPPVIQRFNYQVNLLIRDGQTIQSTMATDPVSGRVTKVEVTLNVVK